MSMPSREPSPEWPGGPLNGNSETSSLGSLESGLDNVHFVGNSGDVTQGAPIVPSEKALGKRKVVETDEPDGELVL